MLKVSELSPVVFPQEFIDILPTHCDSCGEENEITESLTILRCPNPRCPEKGVQRLVALLKDLGVKNMGEAKCRKFMEYYNIYNPYAIFMYEPSDGVLFPGCSPEFSQQMYEQVDEKRKMLLWEFLKIGNLPGIRDSARHLLAEYNDLEEFFDDVEGGGVAFIQQQLSIRGKSTTDYDEDEDIFGEGVSIKAIEVYNTLMDFKDELLEAVEYIDIKPIGTQIINICISTAVGKPYTSKSDFVSKMNNEFGHKVHLNFLSSVTRDCQFLIWSKEGTATSKVKKALKYQDQGYPIEIMTGAEFKAYLESL